MGVLAVILLMVTLSAAVPMLRPDLVLRVDKERPHGLTVSCHSAILVTGSESSVSPYQMHKCFCTVLAQRIID
jgi:hypothetical protein